MKLVSYTEIDDKAIQKLVREEILEKAEIKNRIDKAMHNIIHENGHVEIDENNPYVITDSKGETVDMATPKERSRYLAKVYYLLGDYKKSDRIASCRNWLQYAYAPATQERKLYKALTCQCRLCPMCIKAKSMANFRNLSSVMRVAQERNHDFIFLTLTGGTRVAGEDLQDRLDMMLKGFNRLFKDKAIRGWGTWTKGGKTYDYKGAIKGYFRAIEITHNTDKYSKQYDTYHPHIHVCLAVKKSYFKGKYINQKEWGELWQKALQVDYNPVLDVRKFKPKQKEDGTMTKPENELAKYTVKDSEFILEDNMDMTMRTVKVLDKALHRKRLTAYGGVLKDILAELNLKEDSDGDEIPDRLDPALLWIIETAQWQSGYNNYYHKYNKVYDPEKDKKKSK